MLCWHNLCNRLQRQSTLIKIILLPILFFLCIPLVLSIDYFFIRVSLFPENMCLTELCFSLSSSLLKVCDDDGWWEGELNGRRGFFPDNFVMIIPLEVFQVSGWRSSHTSPVWENRSVSTLFIGFYKVCRLVLFLD